MANTVYYPNGNTSSVGGNPASNNTSTSFLNLLINMLQTGLTISNGDGSYCCPECLEGTQRVYFLASIPKAIQILNNLGYQSGDTLDCCLNISSSTSTPAYQYLNSLFKYDCCPNNFSTCVNDLTKKLGADCCNELQQVGIVEYGTLELTETSPFCSILTNLLKVTPPLTDSELCAIYKEILDTGIVIKCDGCTMTVEKGPDFPPCFCYKISVPEVLEVSASVKVTCQGIPVTHTGLTFGDYYYCSSSTPIVSSGVTYTELADCALVPCTTPPPPCTCYEFVIQAPQSTPIPVQLSCNGQLTTEYLTQGVFRFCSDSYPIVSPEVVVTAINDCDSEPCLSPPRPNCACYSVYNPSIDISCSYEYTDCANNSIIFTTIAPGQTFYFCAALNSVIANTCVSPLPLVITQIASDCTNCIAPTLPVCTCYSVNVSDPNNPGFPLTCSVDHTDCNGNPVTTLISTSGYICSQTVPVATCRGVVLTYTVISTGDCNNPLIGCPPIIP